MEIEKKRRFLRIAIALCVQSIGASKICHQPEPTQDHLRHLTETILSQPKFAQASVQAGKLLRAMEGVASACDKIERLKNKKTYILGTSRVIATNFCPLDDIFSSDTFAPPD